MLHNLISEMFVFFSVICNKKIILLEKSVVINSKISSGVFSGKSFPKCNSTGVNPFNEV